MCNTKSFYIDKIVYFTTGQTNAPRRLINWDSHQLRRFSSWDGASSDVSDWPTYLSSTEAVRSVDPCPNLTARWLLGCSARCRHSRTMTIGPVILADLPGASRLRVRDLQMSLLQRQWTLTSDRRETFDVMHFTGTGICQSIQLPPDDPRRPVSLHVAQFRYIRCRSVLSRSIPCRPVPFRDMQHCALSRHRRRSVTSWQHG